MKNRENKVIYIYISQHLLLKHILLELTYDYKVPGAMLNLFVQTNDYNAKYKGFFARAVDSKGRVVGTWHQWCVIA